MRLKKLVIFMIICSIPLLLLVNTWQMYRYNTLGKELSIKEEEQKVWMEKNKKMIAGIAVLRSPARIEKVAQEELGLEKIDSERITTIIIE
jgi:cell division protein FtsL